MTGFAKELITKSKRKLSYCGLWVKSTFRYVALKYWRIKP